MSQTLVIHHSSICLPGCHISRFCLSHSFSQSVSFAPWQQATISIHCPAPRLLFSLFRLCRNTSACQTASTGMIQTISKDNQKSNGKHIQELRLHCIFITLERTLHPVKRTSYYCHHEGYIFSPVSLSVISRISRKI